MKNVDNALMDALSTLLLPVYPNVYVGDEIEYIVTNYNVIPTVYAERLPAAARYLVQVHYYLPTGKNPNSVKQSIQSALSNAGFTYPSITQAHDKDGQHWIFECEYVNAGGVYGYT